MGEGEQQAGRGLVHEHTHKAPDVCGELDTTTQPPYNYNGVGW